MPMMVFSDVRVLHTALTLSREMSRLNSYAHDTPPTLDDCRGGLPSTAGSRLWR